ncbi:hypothetical protein [Flavobacterium sp. J27]|uniref:hypothetical protein n=1 Tax=Flavobacterium sp. J27 TaxID=2060419 RepID=UPI0010309472|nr:hypothetical protein [Flavobacterium sp. J27]
MIFISCKKEKQIEVEHKIEITNAALINNELETSEIDSSLLSFDSIVFDNNTFYLERLDNHFWKDKSIQDCNFILFNSNHDTLYKHNGLTSGYEIKDFNEDGFMDIQIDYITNVPGINDILLFDTINLNFRLVKDFDYYPYAIKIQGTEYYYSYHRAGCADLNWESDLFYIQNFECFKIGNISGRGCDGEERNGIIISKIKGNKKMELEYIKRDVGYYGDKWESIDNYWKKNYKKFIPN